MNNNRVYVTVEGDHLRIHYESKYATGSCPINSLNDLIREIEHICGVGSYCFYYKPEEYPFGYAKAIEYNEYKAYPNLPRLTYWQQGVKTDVLEEAREAAIKVWGRLPELEIGWLENKLKTFVN